MSSIETTWTPVVPESPSFADDTAFYSDTDDDDTQHDNEQRHDSHVPRSRLISPACDNHGDILMTNTRGKSDFRKASARRSGTAATTKGQHRFALGTIQDSRKPSRSRLRNARNYFDYDENTSEATIVAGNPELIDRHNLVRLAARYPVVAIMRAVNSAHITTHPQGIVTLAALQKRLTRAIDRIARDTKRPKTEIQREFQAKRKENGLQPGSKLMSDISEGAALSLLHQAAMGLQQNDGSANIDQYHAEHYAEDSAHNAASEAEWIGEETEEATIIDLGPSAMERVTPTKPVTPRLRAKTTTPPSLRPATMQQDSRRISAFEIGAISTPSYKAPSAALRRPSTGTWRDLPPISSSRATYTLPPLITTALVNPTASPAFSSPKSSFSSPPLSFSSNSVSTNSFNSNTTTSSATTGSNSSSFSSSLMSSSVNKNFDAAWKNPFALSPHIDPYLDDRVYQSTKPNYQTYSNIRETSDHTGHTNPFRSFGCTPHSSKGTSRPNL